MTATPFARIGLALFGDPFDRALAVRGIRHYISDAVAFRRAQAACPTSLRLSLRHLYPRLSDRFNEAASLDKHYFLQDIWAAEQILRATPQRHVDVGSRVDGFVSHLLCWRDVEVVDVRPLSVVHPRLRFRQGTLTALPYDDASLESVSCLHTLEHVGLGRYGDEIDVCGHLRAMTELSRVVATGGRLYVSMPLGVERLEFNAHRVLAPETVLRGFSDFELVSFRAIDDAGALVEDREPSDFARAVYACGLFELRKASRR